MTYLRTRPEPSLYEVHLGEAEYLWARREHLLAAPDRTLEHVDAREARLLAHVDALALGGGELARRLLVPALEAPEVERVAAAALALLQQDGTAGLDAVRKALVEGPSEAQPGLQAALEVSGREEVLPMLAALLTPHAEPPVAAVALEVHAAHGRCPAIPLEPWLEHPEPAVVAAACRVLPGTSLSAALQRAWARALESPAREVRDAALAAGAVLGLRAAWTRCRQWAEGQEHPGRMPLLLLALGGDLKEHGRLVALLDHPGARLDATWALGHGGRPEGAVACLQVLEQPDSAMARLAAEAFASITGFPLEGDNLLPEEPPEDAPDAPPLPDVEAALPRVRPAAARAWWERQREQRRFTPGARYLAGVPFSASALVRAFATAPARRWPVLALELAIRTRGRHRVCVRDFWARRHRQLSTVAGFASRGEQPFSSLFDA